MRLLKKSPSLLHPKLQHLYQYPYALDIPLDLKVPGSEVFPIVLEPHCH